VRFLAASAAVLFWLNASPCTGVGMGAAEPSAAPDLSSNCTAHGAERSAPDSHPRGGEPDPACGEHCRQIAQLLADGGPGVLPPAGPSAPWDPASLETFLVPVASAVRVVCTPPRPADLVLEHSTLLI